MFRTQKARFAEFQERHPRLYASRHIAVALLEIGAVLLGLNLFFKHIFGLIPWPNIGMPDINVPSIDLPSIPLPDIDLPDLAMPGWMGAVLSTTKYWVPLLIAVGIAVHEVQKRRTAAANENEVENADGRS